MKTIGAFEAKTHFSQLLERAEKGEEITITRRGKPVAKLVPMQRKRATPEEIRAAFARMEERAKTIEGGPISWEEWKRYRDEGRK